MTPTGFKPATPASKRPQIHVAIGIGFAQCSAAKELLLTQSNNLKIYVEVESCEGV